MPEPKTAWLFPGQGSQEVGMGKDLYETFPSSRQVFDEADAVLGFSLSKLCFEGPADVLRATVHAQPAILTASIACWRAAQAIGHPVVAQPLAFVAGHSLGEYSALVAAGVLDLATGVRLVRERGRLMQEAGERHPSTMAAIIGLDESTVEEICHESGAEIANKNSPGQIVVSGTNKAIAKAIHLAVQRKARRATQLNVGAAFHSSLMKSAETGMRAALAETPLKEPQVPLVGNVTGRPLTSAVAIREELVRQIRSPVEWQRSIELMADTGVTTFVEFGPGKVLTGLVKRIVPGATLINLSDVGSLEQM